MAPERLRDASDPAPLRRSVAERGAAWAATGPLGHLYSTLADLVVLWARCALSSARRLLGRG